jgi:isoleucyl-tRNA synthetase
VYGEDDYNLGVVLDLPVVQLLNERAEYNEKAPEFLRGTYIKQAEKEIKQYLTEANALFSRQQHTHSYPRCWRCETPLIYNAIPAWFINIQKIKPRLIELNEKISWYPDHLKHGRFLNILETAPDWNISRNRYWATPLPFWKCINTSSCGAVACIGSVKELKEKAMNFDEVFSTDVVADIDVHKHIVDRIVLKCDACTGAMERVPEVIDCWVESASMPFAEFHYPFENEEVFKSRFPGQYIAEYIAQTRAWFYYMHAMAALLFDDVSFQHCVTTGTILNEKGEKLSKSKMNYTDPWITINQYGVDALRYYLMTSVVMDADNLFFNDREVREVYNKVINTLWNVLEFYVTYARDIPSDADISSHPLDLWILSRLHSLIREVTTQMDAYNTVKAGRPIKAFIDDLSTWYLRRSRDRFKSENEDDRRYACTTMRKVLNTLSKIMAPFTPFIAEEIFQGVSSQKDLQFFESVHLEEWPSVTESFIDEQLERDMDTVRSIVEMAHSLRAESGNRVRQPLSRLICNQPLTPPLYALIADEVNVKQVSLGDIPSHADWIVKEYGEIRVALNTVLTQELREEGMVREIVRHINATRKDQGLTPKDVIILEWDTDDPDCARVIAEHAESIAISVIAKALTRTSREDMQKVNLGEQNFRIHIARP